MIKNRSKKWRTKSWISTLCTLSVGTTSVYNGFLVYHLVLVIGSILGCLLYFISSSDYTPKFHVVRNDTPVTFISDFPICMDYPLSQWPAENVSQRGEWRTSVPIGLRISNFFLSLINPVGMAIYFFKARNFFKLRCFRYIFRWVWTFSLSFPKVLKFLSW